MPAWIFRRAKSLDLCGLQRAETEQVVSYPLKAQKCCSIVPRGTEKAGKKFLTSYPLFVATRLPAVELVCFQTFLIGGCLLRAALFFLIIRYKSRTSCRFKKLVYAGPCGHFGHLIGIKHLLQELIVCAALGKRVPQKRTGARRGLGLRCR